MRHLSKATDKSVPAIEAAAETAELHARCGVYTKPDVVNRVLDGVGWRATADLREARLLEPAAGDGAFLTSAAVRLVQSCRASGVEPKAPLLKNRISAWELHPDEAERARHRVQAALAGVGLHPSTARACAKQWIRTGDYLLADIRSGTYTHAIGNPPYVRWSKIPPNMRQRYEQVLDDSLVGGDLLLPFLNSMFGALRPGGQCGVVCSDRWMHMGYADAFRAKWLGTISIASNTAIDASEAFVDAVDAYPTILIAAKQPSDRPVSSAPIRLGRSLEDLGCSIRVGPALGHREAFVLEAEEDGVEEELLQPWIAATEIDEGRISWGGRRVIAMHEANGTLRKLNDYPQLARRLSRFKGSLSERSIVSKGAPWHRPIDRILAQDWERPKLLLPEIAKTPRVAIDRTGAIPSHGVYAIFVNGDDIEQIYEVLRDGRLAKGLTAVSPRLKGGYMRCYKKFLLKARF